MTQQKVKFRAWDGIEKKMVYDVIIANGKAFYKLPSGLPGGVISPEPLQFTGLHDKNGKEIYKGDMVKDRAGLGEIIFEEGQFVIRWLFENTKETWQMDRKFKDSEVIGNIYENPELLKTE